MLIFKYSLCIILLSLQIDARVPDVLGSPAGNAKKPISIIHPQALEAKERKATKKTAKKAAQERGKQEGLNSTITYTQKAHAYISTTPKTPGDARAAIDHIAQQREEIEEHTAWQIKAILDVIDTKQIARLPANSLAAHLTTYEGIEGFLQQILAHPGAPKKLKKDIKSTYIPRLEKIIKIARQGIAKHSSLPDTFARLKKIDDLKTPVPNSDKDMVVLLQEWDQERQSLYLVQDLAVKEFVSLLALIPNTYIEDVLPKKLGSKSFTLDMLKNMDDRYKKIFLFLNSLLTHPDITENTKRSITVAMLRLKRLHRAIKPLIDTK